MVLSHCSLLLSVTAYIFYFHLIQVVQPITDNDFLQSIFDDSSYQKVPPRQALGTGTTTVQLGIYINSFDSINEQEMDFVISIYLRQNWTDERLAYQHEPALSNRTFIKLEDAHYSRLWLPDVYFRNEKSAKFHSVTVPNRMLNIYKNGVVFFVSKITATLSCPMDLQKYPLDTQICPMYFESFGYEPNVVQYIFRPNKPVEIAPGLQLSQFDLDEHNYNLRNCTHTFSHLSCLKIEFILERETGFYMVQVYIPTILIVIMSWITFWIHADAIPARTSIGLLTVLTMTTKSSAAGASMPKVSYIKAIDVWMSACLIFVFSSLLEFAIVHVLARRYAQEQLLQQQQQQQQHPSLQQSLSVSSTKAAASAAAAAARESMSISKQQTAVVHSLSRGSNRSSSDIEMRLLSTAEERVTDISLRDDTSVVPPPVPVSGAGVRWRSAAGSGGSGMRARSASPAAAKSGGQRSSFVHVLPFEDFSLASDTAGELPMIDAQPEISQLSNVPVATPCPHDPGAPYHLCQRCLTCRRRAPAFQAVDQFARAFFPILFILFNAAYWIFYLVIL